MALKQPLLGSVDVVDVMSVLDAFQSINTCHLTVEMWLESGQGVKVMVLEMRAWDVGADKQAVQPLASLLQRIGLSGPRSMEAAILQGLYGLDAQLAEKEFAKTITRKRSFPT